MIISKDAPHILAVNPWIHDFSAYDVWAKPVGLLTLISILRLNGYRVSYVDCLDRFHENAPLSDPKQRNGRGPYLKTKISKPEGLKDIPRRFSRYGILPEWLRQDLASIPRPDLILVTSMMTYWAPGVQETIRMIKKVFPDTPVVLGGIYATLCREHALGFSGADEVVSGPFEDRILELVSRHTQWHTTPQFDPDDLDTYPLPAFDLQRKIGYIPLLTSRGCPFSCEYCASHFLSPTRLERSAESVVEEIRYWYKNYDVSEFALYDDAFLVNAETHALPILERWAKSGINFRIHTPNALHIRGIRLETARLMFSAGFKTLRLGLETADAASHRTMDSKVTLSEFRQAAAILKEAGFEAGQIGVYLLVGLPEQSIASVVHAIRAVKDAGATPIPAYYSPIPHTSLWEEAVSSSRYDLPSDPIYTNNSISPCQKEPFSWKPIARIKSLVKT